MNLADIRFPIEGNVQNLVHFLDNEGNYTFTFGSPFCYASPVDLKVKKAFLLGSFNQMKKKNLNADAIFTYYINSEEKKPHPDRHIKASVRESNIYLGDGTHIGSVHILLQRGMFRSYAGMNPNPIYTSGGELIGFCHYNQEHRSKDVYTCDPTFPHLSKSLKNNQIEELQSAGTVHRVYSYDVVECEEVDTRDRFMAIFSPSKKSELVNNRIRFFGCGENEERQALLLTSLFAFFWGTYIDVPLS